MKSTLICVGIDPGLTGGVFAYDGRRSTGFMVPSVKAKHRGNIVSWPMLTQKLDTMLASWHGTKLDIHAVIESVSARPGQGVSSVFKFGYVAGGLHVAMVSLGAAVTFVTPTTWKRRMGLGASKDHARAKAADLFPSSANLFARKKDDGVAEAALLAWYGYVYVLEAL